MIGADRTAGWSRVRTEYDLAEADAAGGDRGTDRDPITGVESARDRPMVVTTDHTPGVSPILFGPAASGGCFRWSPLVGRDGMSEDDPEVEIEAEDDEIEVEVEREDVSREEVAGHLETFAGTLREGGPFDVEIDGETVTISPPDSLEFEVEIEDEDDDDETERSIEFEIEWTRGDDEDPLPEGEE